MSSDQPKGSRDSTSACLAYGISWFNLEHHMVLVGCRPEAQTQVPLVLSNTASWALASLQQYAETHQEGSLGSLNTTWDNLLPKTID